jgi:hypothetical protein
MVATGATTLEKATALLSSCRKSLRQGAHALWQMRNFGVVLVVVSAFFAAHAGLTFITVT